LVPTLRRAITYLCLACPGCFKQETSSWRIIHAIHIIFGVMPLTTIAVGLVALRRVSAAFSGATFGVNRASWPGRAACSAQARLSQRDNRYHRHVCQRDIPNYFPFRDGWDRDQADLIRNPVKEKGSEGCGQNKNRI